VITVKRIGAAIAVAAMAVTVSACGNSDSASSAPAAPTSAEAAANGVTTPLDTFGAACSKLPQGDAPGSLNAMGPEPVASAASSNPLLSTLVTAVKDAGLVDTLNSEKAITVFAPFNGAFDEVQKALGAQKFNALLADKSGLGNLLKYHVIAQRYDRTGLVLAGSVPTLAGGDLQIKDAGPTISVTDGSGQTATVLCGNVPTANATVFVIDKVLMPAKS